MQSTCVLFAIKSHAAPCGIRITGNICSNGQVWGVLQHGSVNDDKKGFSDTTTLSAQQQKACLRLLLSFLLPMPYADFCRRHTADGVRWLVPCQHSTPGFLPYCRCACTQHNDWYLQDVILHLGYDGWWEQDMQEMPLKRLSDAKVTCCHCTPGCQSLYSMLCITESWLPISAGVVCPVASQSK